jgi:hypothetical protein
MKTRAFLLPLLLPLTAFAADAVAPCDNIGTKPTIRQCWACFQSLLDSCGESTTPERREACFTGANSFFSWCLDRVPGVTTGTDVERALDLYARDKISYEELITLLDDVD